MKHIAYIHGLNSSPSSFSYISGRLPEHTSYLLRYNSYQSLTNSINETFEQLPKDTTLTLIGHSLGGVIAAIIAADHPEMIEKLVTISAPFKGSYAASLLRWLPGSMTVLNDIVPRGAHISRCCELELEVPTLNLITVGGHVGTMPEPNDGVVTVASQRALRFGQKIEINATHFEVLLNDTTVAHIKDFVFGDDHD